jgi:arylsulfatase A-like enzyme
MKDAIIKIGFLIIFASASLVSAGIAAEEWPFLKHYDQAHLAQIALPLGGIGTDRQPEHEYLYMEFPAYGGQQMVRFGNWKGVRQGLLKNLDAPIELYDLAADIGERNDLAQKNPEIVERIRRNMKSARHPSKEFPFPALDS